MRGAGGCPERVYLMGQEHLRCRLRRWSGILAGRARHVVYAGKCCPALGVVWSAPLDRGVIAILSLSRVGPQIFVPNFGA